MAATEGFTSTTTTTTDGDSPKTVVAEHTQQGEFLEFTLQPGAKRALPEQLKERLQHSYRAEHTVDEIRADSERLTERSRQLREAHLEHIKDKAAKESQRIEEASERRRRLETSSQKQVLDKMEAQEAKAQEKKREQEEKREHDRARRIMQHEAAFAKREGAELEGLLKAKSLAEREEKASEARETQLDNVVKRSSAVVHHAMQVAETQRQIKTTRGADEGEPPAELPEEQQPQQHEHGESGSHERPLDSPHQKHAPIEPLPTPGLTPRPSEEPPRQSPRRHSATSNLVHTAASHSMTYLREDKSPERRAPFEMRAEAMPKQKMPTMPTPRLTETPRRPEMPTILEEDYEDDFVMPFKTSNFERSFERTFFRMLNPNGSSFVYMYEIRWADGSSRYIQGVPTKKELLQMSEHERIIKRL